MHERVQVVLVWIGSFLEKGEVYIRGSFGNEFVVELSSPSNNNEATVW